MDANVLTANDVFEIALEIERSGARYYRRAAEVVTNAELAELLNSLAQMEEDHERTFIWMRSELGPELDRATAEPNREETLRYLRGFADGLIFDASADLARDLGASDSVSEILLRAIAAEKDSIAIYAGIRELVPPAKGRGRIDEIIREEMSHAALLSEQLSAVQLRAR